MPEPVKSRPAPLSVRLSRAERDDLIARAGDMPVSSYVKRVLFEAAPQAPALPQPGPDRVLLAHLLATLGGSNIAPNLLRLAEAAESGRLAMDAEAARLLCQACDDIRLMHNALMRGLGLKESAPSQREAALRETFAGAAKPEDRQ